MEPFAATSRSNSGGAGEKLNARSRLNAGARNSPLSGGSVQPRSAAGHGLRHRAQSGSWGGCPEFCVNGG